MSPNSLDYAGAVEDKRRVPSASVALVGPVGSEETTDKLIEACEKHEGPEGVPENGLWLCHFGVWRRNTLNKRGW